MPKACTMDLKKCGDSGAAQTCKKSPFSAVCVHLLLLKGTRSPGVPAQPVQPHHSSVTWACHRPTLIQKQVTGSGSHQELPVGVSWQRKTFCFSRLIVCLCSPKRAARGQLHHADCFTLLFFLSFFLQIHNLLCLRDPAEWVSVISSFWEQLGWYRLNAKAAPAPLSLALAVLVAPTRPSSSSLHCLNILCCCCPGCHHE